MTVQDYRDLLRAQPFIPFRLILSSGDRIEVRHPEMATLIRNKIIIAVPDEDGELPEMETKIALFHIVGFEPIGTESGVTSAS